jgi:hypothetical protein
VKQKIGQVMPKRSLSPYRSIEPVAQCHKGAIAQFTGTPREVVGHEEPPDRQTRALIAQNRIFVVPDKAAEQ